MVIIPDNCYPSNYFDPFGHYPTHGACKVCGETHDYDDMHVVGCGLFYEYHLCQECFENRKDEDE
jgi:hypothetical protein